MVRKLAKDTAIAIKENGGPDVVEAVRKFLKNNWRIDTRFAGEQYGKATKEGEKVREIMKDSLKISGERSPSPTFCYTFSSKAMACLLELYQKGVIKKNENVIFWCTKSLVQPMGGEKPWNRLKSVKRIVGASKFLEDSGLRNEKDYENDVKYLLKEKKEN